MTSRKEVKIFCLLLSLVLTLLIFSSAESDDSGWCTDASTETFSDALEINLDLTSYVEIREPANGSYYFLVAGYQPAVNQCSSVLPADSLNMINTCLDKHDYAIVQKSVSGETGRYYIYPRCQTPNKISPEIFGIGFGGMFAGGMYGGMGGMYGGIGGIGGIGGMYGGMSGGMSGGIISPYSGFYGATNNYAAGYGGIAPYGGLFGGLSGLFGISGGVYGTYGTHPVDPFSGIPGRLDGGNWNIAANQYNPTLGSASPGASFLPNISQPAFPFGQQNGSFLSPMAPLLSGTVGGALPFFTGLNTTFPNVLPDVINASAEPTRNAQFFSPFRPQFPNIPNRNPSFLNWAFPW